MIEFSLFGKPSQILIAIVAFENRSLPSSKNKLVEKIEES